MKVGALYQFVLKVLASGVLVWIVALCLWGFNRLWWPSRLVYRSFSYTRDGTDDSAAGLHFTQLVNAELRRLHRMLSPPAGADAPLMIPTVNQQGARVEAVELPSLPESLLPAIEIQAYGIRLGTLLNALSRQIVPPNEVVGSVTERKERFNAYVELHQNQLADAQVLPAGLADQIATKEEAAFVIACRIYHLLGARRGMIYDQASDAEFEVFARALQQYQLYRSSLAALRPPEAADQALKETERLVNGLTQQNTQFPLVYKLAALVASSKGHLKDAIPLLETYQRLWPAGLKIDQNAQSLLKEFKEKDEQASEQLTAVWPGGGKSPRQKWRPVRPGTSVSVDTSKSGYMSARTICCIVRDIDDPKGPRYILLPHDSDSSPGSAIVQPGLLDGGNLTKDVIGEVVRTIALKPGQANAAAGTIARLNVEANPTTPEFGFNGVASAQVGQVVRKYGRTTGLSTGTVTGIHVSAQISIDEGPRQFSELIEVRTDPKRGFSDAGDTGAAVVDAQNRLIGMVFAGSTGPPYLTFVMPIEPILKELRVELVR